MLAGQADPAARTTPQTTQTRGGPTAPRPRSAGAARRTARTVPRGSARSQVIRPRRSCTSEVTIWVPSPLRPGLKPSGSPRPSSATHTSSSGSSSSTRRSASISTVPPPAARPCSTALCTSSLMISASGGRVLRPQPAERAPPAGAHRHLPGGHLHHRGQLAGDDVVEVHRLVETLAQRLVHDRDRAHPADGLVEGGPRLVVGQPPGLHPQQRRHRLQVVLDPVVDLADGRVLGQQVALAPAQLADVTQQQDARRCAVRPRSAGSPAATRSRRARPRRCATAPGRSPPAPGSRRPGTRRAARR